MKERKKTLIEHVGVLPIQGLLEAESWGSYRKESTRENLNCCINARYAKGKPNVGGFRNEDVFTADILMTLAFMKPSFLAGILNERWPDCMQGNEDFEVLGQSGNYYYPHYFDLPDAASGKCEDKDFIRLAQPDGWIATPNALILIEAKGIRDGAGFNYAQLAKEYLIAKVESGRAGNRIQPRILLLVSGDYAKKEAGKLWSRFQKDWGNLFEEKSRWSRNRAELMQRLIPREKRECPISQSQFSEIFKILTYTELLTHAETEVKTTKSNDSEHKLAEMLCKTIHWHLAGQPDEDNMPLWSQFLAELAAQQVPLYHFYNGGAGFALLEKYEDRFFNEGGIIPTCRFRSAIENQRQYIEGRSIALPNSRKLTYEGIIAFAPEVLYRHFAKKAAKTSSAELNGEFFKGKRGLNTSDISIGEIYSALNCEYQESPAKETDTSSVNPEVLGISRSDGLRKALRLFSWKNWDNSANPYRFFAFERTDFFNGKKICKK